MHRQAVSDKVLLAFHRRHCSQYRHTEHRRNFIGTAQSVVSKIQEQRRAYAEHQSQHQCHCHDACLLGLAGLIFGTGNLEDTYVQGSDIFGYV